MRLGPSPVYAFQKNPTMVDYPGRLAALFFVTGCNFRCGFCHNAGVLLDRREGMSWERLEAACERFRDHWVDAAVITGGEPTLVPDLPVLIGVLKKHGFKIKLDTNGSAPRAIGRVLQDVDYVAMDVKCSEKTYPELTGFDDTEKICESMDLIKSAAPAYEFRTTVIPSIHTDAEMSAVKDMVRGAKRYVLQPFIPRDDLPDPALRQQPRTTADRLREIKARCAGCADEIVCRE